MTYIPRSCAVWEDVVPSGAVIRYLSCVGDASSSSSSEEEEETTGEDEVDMDNKGGTISKIVCS